MRRQGVLLMLSAMLAVSGCASGGGAPAKTQLEIREYQTRSFDSDDPKLVVKAVLNVLMDEGFIVREANSELGFLTAARELDVEDRAKAFMSRILYGNNARWDKNSILEVTANVSRHGSQTRVRANFQLKVMDNKGVVSSVRAMGDEAYYQEFFAKVDKGIFLEKEQL